MPGFTTHYLFGESTIKKLPNNLVKEQLTENRNVFNLGLQGPDIFFYCLPAYLFYFTNIGAVAHTTTTGKFLEYLIKSRKFFQSAKEQEIASAYIMGFCGHYMLDTNCHPYVYYRSHYHGATMEYFARHVNLEADIDTFLLFRMLQKLPSEFPKENLISLNHKQRKVIATLLYYVYKHVYPDLKVSYAVMYSATYGMQAGSRVLHDKTGQRKALARKAESYLLGHAYLSPMIPSDTLTFYKDPLNFRHRTWKNPWNRKITSTKSFFDLYQNALNDYMLVLEHFNALLPLPYSSVEDSYTKDLLAFMGNKSYHSGLDSSIPS